MTFIKCIDDSFSGDVRWGVDTFLDSDGNEFVLTAQYGAELGWHISEDEANALTKQLGVE